MPDPLRVLYIHPVRAFGGASRSLYELIRGFAPDGVAARIVVPRGAVADFFEQRGFPVLRVAGLSRFDTTRFGHYRGLRWLILLREIAYLPATLLAIWRARRRWPEIDLIHVNEVTAILPGLLAKAVWRKPLVVHVRSVQETQRARWRRSLLERLLRRSADAVVAIDETVRTSLPKSVSATVLHNGFTVEQATMPLPAVERLREALHPGSLRVGMVGTLLALKGVFEFLEAARRVLEQGANVDFVLVGSNTRRLGPVAGRVLQALGFAQDMDAEVERVIAARGLAGRVHRVEFLAEVSAVYALLDVVCFPSHLDAIGRPVLEAAWFSLPSIAAVSEPSADTFVPGETGVRVPARDAQALAQAILRLHADRQEAKRMGARARQLAERNFDSRRNAATMLEIYRRIRR